MPTYSHATHGASRGWWPSYIRSQAGRYGLDPRALLAVARQEGLSGGVGDAGTSFGPFQLHVGGALPRGRGQGWAESRAGLDYALSRIAASGARGLSGRAAIEAIVRNFERPAAQHIAPEIARALAAYGMGAGPSVQAPQAPGAPQAASGGQAWAQALLNPRTSHDPMRLLGAIRATQAVAAPAATGSAPPATPSAASHGSLAELFYDPLGAFKNGQPIPAIGGHSDHVHISTTNAAAMLAAINQAQRMGLHVGENPYVGAVNPVHVTNSYHYRRFPGRYGGKALGEAADISGSAAQMAAFFRWARRNLR